MALDPDTHRIKFLFCFFFFFFGVFCLFACLLFNFHGSIVWLNIHTCTHSWLTKFCYLKVKLLSHVQLCDPMDCSLPGFSIHGIFQARVLEWVAISFSRGSSWPRDQTQVSCIAGRRFTLWATREAHQSSVTWRYALRWISYVSTYIHCFLDSFPM